MHLRPLRFAALVLGLFLFSLAAHAESECGIYTACEPDFYGWGEEPTGGGYNPPTATRCEARASSNQSCRYCARAYDDNGYWKGYFVCAHVQQYSHCSCANANTPNCEEKGVCTYYP